MLVLLCTLILYIDRSASSAALRSLITLRETWCENQLECEEKVYEIAIQDQGFTHTMTQEGKKTTLNCYTIQSRSSKVGTNGSKAKRPKKRSCSIGVPTKIVRSTTIGFAVGRQPLKSHFNLHVHHRGHDAGMLRSLG